MTTKEFYDSTASQYDLRQNNPSTKWLRRHEEALIKKYANGKILDIGCGTGHHLQFLKKNGFSDNNLTGIDISSQMISEARKKLDCGFVCGEAEKLPFPDSSFDTMLCMHSSLNLMDIDKVLNEIRRVQKDGGVFIASISSAWDKEYKPFWQRLGETNIKKKTLHLHKYHMDFTLFTKKSFLDMMEKHGFQNIYFKGLFILQRPYWGRFQPFSRAEKIKLRFGDSMNIFNRAGSVYLGVFRK